jgi:hypothetical protein
MKKIAYKVGMIVEHPNRPEWGPGKVVAVGDDRVHVMFRDEREPKAKAILPALMPLRIAAVQSDEFLDQLPPAAYDGDGWVLTRKQKAKMPAADLTRPAPPHDPRWKRAAQNRKKRRP